MSLALTNTEFISERNAESHFLEWADIFRIESSKLISDEKRATFGQFLTPPHVARRMAEMFKSTKRSIKLLDAGAGVGILTAAFVENILKSANKPECLELVACEIENIFFPYLEKILNECRDACIEHGIKCSYKIHRGNFIEIATDSITNTTRFETNLGSFTHAVLNPPYKKLNSDSNERRLLKGLGIETSNYYSAFIWLVNSLLAANGEIVWISPRSFCNGPYFLPFRKHLFNEMAIQKIHIFESRDVAFQSDEVLQENVIVHAEKSSQKPASVFVNSSRGGVDDDILTREVSQNELVNPFDSQLFIHLLPNHLDTTIKDQVERLPNSLADLGISVSTGRVVDFRAKEWLRNSHCKDTVPLIYPHNFTNGEIIWPLKQTKKPIAIVDNQASREQVLIRSGIYVLVKRFSAKEEKKRIVAALFDPNLIPNVPAFVGFENHLNYFHKDGEALEPSIAKGLCAFLNSSLIDGYFRQFNGHTQVNASDLRNLRYPSSKTLKSLGSLAFEAVQTQTDLDAIIHKHLDLMAETSESIAAKTKIGEALTVLRALSVPREQQNERSALTLLALLGLRPTMSWGVASSPLLGITQMMDFFRDEYGKAYAPNTRETVRRQTVHQFVQLGLLVENPDRPQRPINSPSWNYQIEASALSLFRTYGSKAFETTLQNYLREREKIRCLIAKEREMVLIPVRLPDGKTLQLSQGGQNTVIKEILEQFCPRFTPGATVLYVGDAGNKFLINEVKQFSALGVVIDEHGKMPDVVVYDLKRQWLILIEAVTSHGPMNLKRHNELKKLFANAKAGLVFVTAFPSRQGMSKYLADIAWETEVWFADAPSHLIHFNGERFLGPYI